MPAPPGKETLAMARSTMAPSFGPLVQTALALFLGAAAVAHGAAPGPSVPAARAAALPRVLAPDGKAVAGATVSFVEFDHSPSGVALGATTTTAADGSFRLLPPKPSGDAEMAVVEAQHVMIEVPGYGITSAYL